MVGILSPSFHRLIIIFLTRIETALPQTEFEFQKFVDIFKRDVFRLPPVHQPPNTVGNACIKSTNLKLTVHINWC